MGNGDTKLERELGPQTGSDQPYLGLENYGNTCYCNSVLQALYYCEPFRAALLTYAARQSSESLLTHLAQLYTQIGAHKRRTGVIGPRKFIQRLKTENGALYIAI
jgi:ubiquitin carboxyl-terminal hydrolase 12/46